MDDLGETMKKEYVAQLVGWDWEVFEVDSDLRVASFAGKFARTYAREHAKRLNALPKEKKP